MKSLVKLHQPEDTPAVYVVHGIGKQRRGQTAAQLYGNFEDAMTAIVRWQTENPPNVPTRLEHLPYAWEGYWADYDKPENALGERWNSYSEEEKDFCRELWAQRVISAGATYRWFLKQTFRLWWSPVRLAKTTGWGVLVAWPLYVLLTLCAVPLLTIAYLRKNDVMRDYLNDIRLYVDPRGKIEHDIVDSIEKSIRRDILRLIGLDPHFRLLDPEAQMTALGKRRRFDRVIWVAHSLGSVISYNVVTELVSEAIRLEKEGDLDQQRGVGRFRECLARFVTLGSPLDKIAFLFKDRLRNWPNVTRNEFFKTNVDDISVRFLGAEKEWWINFYHVLDPVSGSLDNPDICGNKPPANFHARSCLIPGLAHVAYWKDLATLRFILSRAYSWRRLRDKPLVQWPTTVLTLLAAGSYVVWAAVMLIALAVMVVWGWELVQTTWEKVVEIGASWGIPIS